MFPGWKYCVNIRRRSLHASPYGMIARDHFQPTLSDEVILEGDSFEGVRTYGTYSSLNIVNWGLDPPSIRQTCRKSQIGLPVGIIGRPFLQKLNRIVERIQDNEVES